MKNELEFLNHLVWKMGECGLEDTYLNDIIKCRKMVEKRIHKLNKNKDLNRRMGFSKENIERFRQWFNSTQDLNPKYLEKEDYLLAKQVYERLNIRVPKSIDYEC